MIKQLLNGSDWTLSGWNRHQWHYEKSMELGNSSVPAVAPIKATVPGSVQTDLFAAGLIEDWNFGDNFRKIEWIEHREWVYTKSFKALKKSDRAFLHLEGLDFSGYVFLNGEQLYYFDNMHLPHVLDVTDKLLFEAENILKIVFLQPPEVDGQVGYTSKLSVFKSRFNYGWDWSPRLVNIGIFRDVWLEYCNVLSVRKFYPKAELVGNIGTLEAMMHITAFEDASLKSRLTLKRDNEIVSQSCCDFFVLKGEREAVFMLDTAGAEPWNPNGFGEQPLYNLELELFSEKGEQLRACEAEIGFRSLSYTAPENAAKGCLPYNPVINGRMIPIRGVNWVPISPFYGSVTEAQYEFYLKRLRDMGCNLIRVWGGALQESEVFYKLCDRLGLMVWQEFPQSSSGIDNAPNEDKECISALKDIAVEYTRRARNHVSLTYWCGGNELYWGENFFPADESSENLKMLKGVVERHKPGIMYLPSSPSHLEGVSYFEGITEWTNGDGHGSWLYEGVDRHYDMIYNSDWVLFSEIGTPACARPEKLKEFCSGEVWPPDFSNPYWTNRGAWWIIYDTMRELFGDFERYGDGKIEKYAAAFRFLQFESIRSSVSAVRRFGARKSGIIIWMANEPFPNAANTSLLEMDGYAKPAYYAAKKGFAGVMAGLYYKSPRVNKGEALSAQLYFCSDYKTTLGDVVLTVYDANGNITDEKSFGNIEVSGVSEFGGITINVEGDISLARLTVAGELLEEWVFTASEIPFEPLLSVGSAEISCKIMGDSRVKVTNKSKSVAFYAELDAIGEDGAPATFDNGYFCLLPGESRICVSQLPIISAKASSMN